jgi:hypothetical protein
VGLKIPGVRLLANTSNKLDMVSILISFLVPFSPKSLKLLTVGILTLIFIILSTPASNYSTETIQASVIVLISVNKDSKSKTFKR